VCSLDAGDADGAAEAVAQPAATREHRIAIPQSPRPPTASSPFCTSQSHRPHHQPLACRRKYAIERGTLSLLTLNLPTTTVVAQPFNIIKWQLKFNPVA